MISSILEKELLEYKINIIEKIKPDVLITQEMIGQESVNNFLNNVLKNINEKYKAADFIDDEDTDIDQGLFYNSNKFSLYSLL